MGNEIETITFVVVKAGAPPTPRPADEAGTRHGMKEAAQAIRSSLTFTRPVVDVQADLERVVAQVRTIIDAVDSSPVGNLHMEGFDVGIAISGEGSIGVATVGAEASVTIRFVNRKSGADS